MTEVLVQFDEPQRSADGELFIAHVLGSRASSGMWRAWIEFHPRDGGEPVRTGRETEQLTRGDLRFWAAGLTRAYLDSALARARTGQPGQSRHSGQSGQSGQSENAVAARRTLTDQWEQRATTAEQTVLDTDLLRSDRPACDPFALFRASGEYRLRQELRLLDARALRDIIAAYDIPELDVIDLARTFEDALAERVVAGVQQVVGQSSSFGAAASVRQPDHG